jgi:hypothetical protein
MQDLARLQITNNTPGKNKEPESAKAQSGIFVPRQARGISICPSQFNSIDNTMYLYVVWCFTHSKNNFRAIKCEKCGAYENLELHHIKYEPKERVYLKDIKILCGKCHRNDSSKGSALKTVFENGERFCVTNGYKFPY